MQKRIALRHKIITTVRDYFNKHDFIEITTPTVIIQGNQDYVVGTGHAELIYNALSGLSSEEKELHRLVLKINKEYNLLLNLPLLLNQLLHLKRLFSFHK